jgi:ABC-type polysaccharide/polyol phosphate export permease
MKGGDDGDFIGTMFASGLGAYAAKNSTSMGGLLWTLFKYGVVIVLILIVVTLVASLFRATTEKFVPVVPSPEQDRKYVTPAGNVITY